MSAFSSLTPPKSSILPSALQPNQKNRSVVGEISTSLDGTTCPPPGAPYVYDDLREVCTLGTGSFGTVKLVHHESSGDVMALKILKKDTIVEFRQETNILSEKKLLLECTSCPFIINLLSTFNFPNKLCMLLELVQGGELLTHLYDRTDTIPRSYLGGFSIDCVKFYVANILSAFEFMHSRDIIYRDLKPENILVNSDGYIKLADFGFAKVIPYTMPNGAVATKTFTVVGSPEYMAPEMIKKEGYNQGVDYWSLGCLIFELLFADSLFADRTGYALLTQDNVKKASKESIIQSFSLSFQENHSDMFQLCMLFLIPDPTQRAGCEDMSTIKESKVFGSQFWADLEERNVQPLYIPSIEHQLDTSNFFDFDEEEEDHSEEFLGNQAVFDLF